MIRALLLSVLVALLTLGCAAKPAEVSPPKSVVEVVAVEGGRAGIASYDAPSAAPMPSMVNADLAEIGDRMIIRTVDMIVVVEDTDATLDLIRKMVAEHKGYIAEANRWLSNEQPYARVTFRVPAASLDSAVAALQKAAIRVENENTRGEDVTEEYVDLDARLRNLEATEKELLVLLTEVRENRGKAEDVLAIHREITNIRAQIESLKGRQQYLSRMSAMATINVEIRPKDAPRTVIQRAKWSPLVTASRALRGFVEMVQVLLDIAIYLLIFSPVILVPAAVIWLLVRWARRRKANRKP
jgi:hypothetical protein